MSTSLAADHVVFNGTKAAFVCKRCGEEIAPALPMRVKTLCVVAQAFMELHRGCPTLAAPVEVAPTTNTDALASSASAD
jgi:hypothetical protein